MELAGMGEVSLVKLGDLFAMLRCDYVSTCSGR